MTDKKRRIIVAAASVVAALGTLVVFFVVFLCMKESGVFAKAGKKTGAEVELGGKNIAFSHAGGFYESEFELGMGAPDGCMIYYTLDGSDPRNSETRMQYTETVKIGSRSDDENVVSAVDPELFDTAWCRYNRSQKKLVTKVSVPDKADVDKCTVVKACSVDKNGSCSEVYSAAYFIGSVSEHIEGISAYCEAAGMPLAVLSISLPFDSLFDYENGIYVRGKLFDEAFEKYRKNGGNMTDDCGRKLSANYSARGREWEREAYLDFYEVTTDGAESVVSQSCGIRIQGNYSRSDLQKGFRLYARKDYGEKRFNYPVFGTDYKNVSGDIMDSYKTLVLRNGGNCAFGAKFNDAFWQSLITELDVSTKRSRPAIVYLNGEYWGLYVLEEDFSSEYFEDLYGVDSDDVVLYKGDAESYASGYKLDIGDLPAGTADEAWYFSDLLNFFKTHSNLVSDADYAEFAKLVDVESVRDYFAVEVWINNKWDWPGKNWSMWKTVSTDSSNPYADGKWRFCVYDVEFGGISGESDAGTNTVKEDNYKTFGLLDRNTNNPAVLCFAYLCSNASFRADFENTLKQLSDGCFEKTRAQERLVKMTEIYKPLYEQFFKRYPGTGSAEEAVNGGYSSPACVKAFIEKRSKYINNITDYIEKTCKSLYKGN